MGIDIKSRTFCIKSTKRAERKEFLRYPVIKSEKDYIKAQKEMLLRIQEMKLEDVNTRNMSTDEAEILMSCVKAGYLIGRYEENGLELRTMDGKAHPELFSTSITPSGAAFLKPNNSDAKATIALIISFLALIVSILSNFLDMKETIDFLICLLKSIISKTQ